ncbi:MAG: deoxyribodipyrimidine photo-lyase [Sediminicola sp.]
MASKISIFWFRRDLRLEDNVGLLAALKAPHPVLPIFIFDPEILDRLPRADPRVQFIMERLQGIDAELKEKHQRSLAVYHDLPQQVFTELIQEFQIVSVYTNRDYEPYAKKRDEGIAEMLEKRNIGFHTFKDQVVFEQDEVVKADGDPYVVFTPYRTKWREHFSPSLLDEHTTGPYLKNLLEQKDLPFPTLEQLGFQQSEIRVLDADLTSSLIQRYESTRNFPGLENGTSKLGPHLRFGTVSIRSIMKRALAEKNGTFWSELVWREFFMQILWHFPHTVNSSFKPQYDRMEWRNEEREFDLWKNGQTGYALVDAGMRELNSTGYMHNRVRMLVASFLCKHLLIDWRWGEAYFAEKLLDYELSSNVGNWQWAAGSGVDAAPYFRIFNPMTQVEKFDKDKSYINKWIPELQGFGYPDKMVDHKMARERCLSAYKEALSN